ncbi:hypothetical protein [Mesonia aquimarina]|uniref:hypothetical protein n=1 Tax=Mesonia aquimarina TaxID=1504967 RepID=UPI000EF61DB2|nr:hypothetical protein [Mesonia aquimarina]
MNDNELAVYLIESFPNSRIIWSEHEVIIRLQNLDQLDKAIQKVDRLDRTFSIDENEYLIKVNRDLKQKTTETETDKIVNTVLDKIRDSIETAVRLKPKSIGVEIHIERN